MNRPGLLRRLLRRTRFRATDPRLDAFFTAAPAGLAILDRELRFRQLNETMAQMNGLPLEAHLGRRLGEILPGLAPALEPILTRIVATGEPELNFAMSGETPAQPGAARHWVASCFPLPRFDQPGDLGAIVVEDTARRHAEQGRRRSGEQYRSIIENATLGIYRSSINGGFLKVNSALVQMLGYASEAEVVALDLNRDVYLNPQAREQLIERFRTTERILGAETEWRRKDGRRITVRLSGRQVRGEHGDLLGFEMMAEDVTEQRAVEHALRQAQKMETIGNLTSGITHDFNSLLTVILAQAEFVADALPENRPDLRRDLDDLSKAALRGADLVQKLLGFSRSQTLDMLPVHLAHHVEEIIRTLRRLLPTTIEIQFEGGDETAVAEVDAGALQQILLNLATNARDAMPDGGTLHVDLRRTRLDPEDQPLHAWVRPGMYACITVSDTGVGMNQETLARVLEPFFTTKPSGVGTGLGMAMVYGLVKQHKGFVHLYSEPGIGTTVKVYFPLVQRASAERALGSTDGKLAGGSESILLVEDDAFLRDVAERLFKKVGYRVLIASDGVEGLDVYRANRSDISLVITDMIMPRASGRDLYEAVRKDSGTMKVLFTSGNPSLSNRQWSAGDANVAFVTKPWTVSDLLARVRQLLDQ